MGSFLGVSRVAWLQGQRSGSCSCVEHFANTEQDIMVQVAGCKVPKPCCFVVWEHCVDICKWTVGFSYSLALLWLVIATVLLFQWQAWGSWEPAAYQHVHNSWMVMLWWRVLELLVQRTSQFGFLHPSKCRYTNSWAEHTECSVACSVHAYITCCPWQLWHGHSDSYSTHAFITCIAFVLGHA